MTPITREELFLAKLSGETVTTPNPITREELFLAKLCGENVETPEPITRIEFFLDSLAGNEHPWLTPMTRLEYFIAAAGGADVPELTPITREEMYWSGIEISGVDWTTVTGAAPLALADALAKPIKKLIQFGKVATVDNETYCNNGKLVAVDDELPIGYKRITGIKFDGATWYDTGVKLRGSDEITITLANTASSGQNVFGAYNGTGSGTKNFSLYVYGGGSTSGSYLRYGEQLGRPKFGSNERTLVINGNGSNGFTTDVTLTPDTFETVATAYIGNLPNSSSSPYSGSVMGNVSISERAVFVPCIRESDDVVGYYDIVRDVFLEPIGTGSPLAGSEDTSHLNLLSIEGTPEVLTIGTQTASVVNLFATDSVADEQNIISGAVTRRTSVSVSGGVITVSALANPAVEQVTAQPMRTAEGSNTVSVASAVDPVQLEVIYAKAGA